MTFILTMILSIIGYIQDSPTFFLAIICLLFFRLLTKAWVKVAEDEYKFCNIRQEISDLKSDIESNLSEIKYEISNLDITCHAAYQLDDIAREVSNLKSVIRNQTQDL